MSRHTRYRRSASLFGALLIATSCSRGPAVEEPIHGESILDKTSHVETNLLTEIPTAPRRCDRIEGLVARRIGEGDAEIHVEVEGQGAPVVLSNGGPGGTHHFFHPCFSRLRKEATVVDYDQRGIALATDSTSLHRGKRGRPVPRIDRRARTSRSMGPVVPFTRSPASGRGSARGPLGPLGLLWRTRSG